MMYEIKVREKKLKRIKGTRPIKKTNCQSTDLKNHCYDQSDFSFQNGSANILNG